MNRKERVIILSRIKNYGIFLLLYVCSLYHFVFSTLALAISSSIWGSWGSDSIIQHIGVQEFKLRDSLLPVYGFETFTLMTCFIVLDYCLIRKPFNPRMSIRQFLDAFLFSQLAYVVYIYRFNDYINGVHAFDDGIAFYFQHIPLLLICFPLSLYLFKIRLKKIMPVLSNEDEQEHRQEDKEDSKKIIIAYLIFWLISFTYAIGAYWVNHYRSISII